MKLILLVAAVAIAAPAIAQTTTDTQTQTDTATTTSDASATAAEQAGGYQPAAPAMSQPATPGATVVFQPSASPDQAFPPPPPMAHYPICKRGQTDKCMEPGHGRK